MRACVCVCVCVCVCSHTRVCMFIRRSLHMCVLCYVCVCLALIHPPSLSLCVCVCVVIPLTEAVRAQKKLTVWSSFPLTQPQVKSVKSVWALEIQRFLVRVMFNGSKLKRYPCVDHRDTRMVQKWETVLDTNNNNNKSIPAVNIRRIMLSVNILIKYLF